MRNLIIQLLGIVASVLPPAVSIPDGSLVFLEHSNRYVEYFTGSGTTHVGMVIDGWVYEATPPNVRRVKVEEYDSEICLEQKKNKKLKVRILLPKDDYSGTDVARMRRHLDGRVGRPYTIWGYILGRAVGGGYHCAQLVSSTLHTTQRFLFFAPWSVTPGNLEKTAMDKYEAVYLLGGK